MSRTVVGCISDNITLHGKPLQRDRPALDVACHKAGTILVLELVSDPDREPRVFLRENLSNNVVGNEFPLMESR